MENDSSEETAAPAEGTSVDSLAATPGDEATQEPEAVAAPGGDGSPPVRDRLRRLVPLIWREARLAVLVAGVTAALGGPLGLIWAAIAPRVELVMTSGGWYPVSEEPEGYIADDGWFAILGCGAGIVVTMLVWRLVRRNRGPAMVLALAGGSVLAALLAEWLGHRIGLAGYLREVDQARVGTTVHRQPALRVPGLVLVQAFVSVALYTLLAAFHYDPSLRSDPGPDPDSGSDPDPGSGLLAARDEPAACEAEPEAQPKLEAC